MRFVQLKKCPFCGSEAKIRHLGKVTDKTKLGIQVRCKCCECGTAPIYPLPYLSYEQRKNIAIERWNKRISEA